MHEMRYVPGRSGMAPIDNAVFAMEKLEMKNSAEIRETLPLTRSLLTLFSCGTQPRSPGLCGLDLMRIQPRLLTAKTSSTST